MHDALDGALHRWFEMIGKLRRVDLVIPVLLVEMQALRSRDDFTPSFREAVVEMLPAAFRCHAPRVEPALNLCRRPILEVLDTDAPRLDETEVPRPRPAGPGQARPVPEEARLRAVGDIVSRQSI